MNSENKICCFFGHRKINNSENLKTKVYEAVENLILNHGVKTFYSAVKVNLTVCVGAC